VDAPRPGRLDVLRPGEGDRDDRRAGREGEPRDSGTAAVEPAVAGAGALGVDREGVAALEHSEAAVERILSGLPGGALHGDRADAREEQPRDQALESLAGEVLGFREERHRAGRHERDHHTVDERQVVARDEHGARTRHVLLADDRRAEEQPREGRQERPCEEFDHSRKAT
jgi:hypothetical protein